MRASLVRRHQAVTRRQGPGLCPSDRPAPTPSGPSDIQGGGTMVHLPRVRSSTASHIGTTTGICGRNGPNGPAIRLASPCRKLGTICTSSSSARNSASSGEKYDAEADAASEPAAAAAAAAISPAVHHPCCTWWPLAPRHSLPSPSPLLPLPSPPPAQAPGRRGVGLLCLRRRRRRLDERESAARCSPPQCWRGGAHTDLARAAARPATRGARDGLALCFSRARAPGVNLRVRPFERARRSPN